MQGVCTLKKIRPRYTGFGQLVLCVERDAAKTRAPPRAIRQARLLAGSVYLGISGARGFFRIQGTVDCGSVTDVKDNQFGLGRLRIFGLDSTPR